VTFVDTNVFMYAVGGPHPLRERARTFFDQRQATATPLVTSAEVVQELLHVYLRVDRTQTLDAALALVDSSIVDVWPVEGPDVRAARDLVSRYPGLGARDLLHLACCHRHDEREMMTFDRGLATAFARR